MSLELEVGRSLRAEHDKAMSYLKSHGIETNGPKIAHSQGVPILSNLLKSLNTDSHKLDQQFSSILCVGGPLCIPGATNVIAIGDIVCLANCLHIFQFVESAIRGNVHIVPAPWNQFPHNYNGPAYQRAIQKFLE